MTPQTFSRQETKTERAAAPTEFAEADEPPHIGVLTNHARAEPDGESALTTPRKQVENLGANEHTKDHNKAREEARLAEKEYRREQLNVLELTVGNQPNHTTSWSPAEVSNHQEGRTEEGVAPRPWQAHTEDTETNTVCQPTDRDQRWASSPRGNGGESSRDCER